MLEGQKDNSFVSLTQMLYETILPFADKLTHLAETDIADFKASIDAFKTTMPKPQADEPGKDRHTEKLYDKYKRISPEKVYRDSINKIIVFNIPDKMYSVGLAGGIWVDPKNYKMKTNRNIGDSIKLYFYYAMYQSRDAIRLIIK